MIARNQLRGGKNRGRMMLYAPKEEWQIGPGQVAHFKSDPIAPAGRTCLVKCGKGAFMVRVDSVDDQGVSHGEIIGQQDNLSGYKDAL